LDTDIGSDIDDAVCLAYLLAQPECDLLGVTTVTGQVVARAKMVSALCKVAGREVPIYPGAETPLIVQQLQPQTPQAAALNRWPHETDFPHGEAVEFLRRTIRAHPGEITLLTIGPLTNIALLFKADPEIPQLLKALVMMCGVFTWSQRDAKEWNALLDPHATDIVYRAQPNIHRSIGLDVTTKVSMEAAEVRERFDTKLLRPVLDFAEVWFTQRTHITFHDPLAAATIFDDTICSFARGKVEVELEDDDILGKTWWTPGEGSHDVAVEVDSARFFEHYFKQFS
jgi:inosine-uridine nucleoside N-ribohydrolase